MKTIYFASDHAASEFVQALAKYVAQKGFEAVVLNDEAHPFTYAQASDAVCPKVLTEGALGISCCGSGIGVSMRANRYRGIRAALVHNVYTAEMAKQHSNANVLCMGARVISVEEAKACVDAFLREDFEGGRHIPRLEQLDAPLEGEKG